MLRRIASASLVRHLEVATSTGGAANRIIPAATSPFALHRIQTNTRLEKRQFSTAPVRCQSAALSSKPEPATRLDAAAELDDFMSVFPDLVRDVTVAVNRYDRTAAADASSWLVKAMLYNVPKGKRNRGLLTVSTYKLLHSLSEASEGVGKKYYRP